MQFDLGNFFPVWPELVGVPIPGTDRKTNLKHALFFGIVSNYCDHGRKDYCYAGTEYLTELLGLNECNLSRMRSDLVKLGWIMVEHGDRNKVVKTYACKVNFVEIGNSEGGSFPKKSKTGTSVSTPVGPESINTRKYMCSSYGNPENEEEGLLSVGSKANMAQGGVVKITTPFGEAPTTVVKPAKNINRFIAPLAQELLTLAGEKVTAPGPALRAAIQARLKQGYTEADLKLIVRVGKDDEFYADKPVVTMLSENGASALLKKAKRKGNGKKPKSRYAQIYGAGV